MIKVLFMIHDLGQGGAEKVLVNLVNNMDRSKFDISVISLFGGGVNERFLKKDIHYKSIFKRTIPGNSKIMKLFTPEFLHKMFVKEQYDIEVSYLEGPSARIISGCSNKKTKLVSWIHSEQKTKDAVASSFRNVMEAKYCYNKFDQTVCVSEYIMNNFRSVLDYEKSCRVLYNVIESDEIRKKAEEDVIELNKECIRLIAVGTLKHIKGYDRLLNIMQKLVMENPNIHLYILGDGPLRQLMLEDIKSKDLTGNVTLLGYKENPYKYVKNSDLYVCSSYSEGFSTAVTEALIVGTPVCTVKVSGMTEMLGNNNEYGVVTDNDETSLYKALRILLSDNELLKFYRKKSIERGIIFDKEKTVFAVENMLESLVRRDVST